jgi:hypothetical protein
MFDWRKLAPERCYLCGLDGAKQGDGGDREHFIPRVLFENGKIPNGMDHVKPLPSHKACNRSTQLDEQRAALTWATARPEGFGSDARYDRAIRTLKRPEAARLRASFLANVEELPSGGAVLRTPNESTEWTLAKMANGIVYSASGRVLDTDLLWWFGTLGFDNFVAYDGTPFDVPNVLMAKYEVDTTEPGLFCAFNVHGFHLFTVAAFRRAGPSDGTLPGRRARMAWPRPKPRAGAQPTHQPNTPPDRLHIDGEVDVGRVGVGPKRPAGAQRPTSRLGEPERIELELDGVERLRADSRVVAEHAYAEPIFPLEPIDLECSCEGIHEPRVVDSLARIDRHLVGAVDRLGAPRKDLAHEIGTHAEVGGAGALESLFAPAGKVGNDDVVTEVQLGFVEENPTPRTAAATVEGTAEVHPEHRRRSGVRRGRPRIGVERAEEHLRDHVRRSVEHVLVGRAFSCGIDHDASKRSTRPQTRRCRPAGASSHRPHPRSGERPRVSSARLAPKTQPIAKRRRGAGFFRPRRSSIEPAAWKTPAGRRRGAPRSGGRRHETSAGRSTRPRAEEPRAP